MVKNFSNLMKKKNALLIIAGFFVFFVSFYFWSVREIHIPKSNVLGKEAIFLVKKGDDAGQISKNLKKSGIINYSFLFKLYVIAKNISGGLKAGNYLLSDRMTIPQIAKKIFLGEVIKKQITIIGGWKIDDIGYNLEKQGILKAKDIFEIIGHPYLEQQKPIKDFSNEFDFLKDKPKDLTLEGYLFPDTYEVFPDQDVEQIVKNILANFDKKLTLKLREEIKKQKKSIFEIITVASLIEKEDNDIEDKKIVSGIIWKRLKINMPLQIDATISYITDKNTRWISTPETKIDSLYNTYKYKGLPKGPICNPGIDSIMAAIYPKQTSYLYYLATPNRITIFSKTLEEHNVAKAKYLR